MSINFLIAISVIFTFVFFIVMCYYMVHLTSAWWNNDTNTHLSWLGLITAILAFLISLSVVISFPKISRYLDSPEYAQYQLRLAQEKVDQIQKK